MFIERSASSHRRNRSASRQRRSRRPLETLEPRVLMAAHDLDPSFGDNATGLFSTGFGSGSIDQFAYTIAQQGDGKLLIGGRGGNSSGQRLASVIRLRPDGSLDNTWGGDGKSSIVISPADTSINDKGDMAVLRNGDVVLVTSAESFNPADDQNKSRMTLVFFEPDGTRNTEFHTNGILQPDFGAAADEVVARAVALLPDGRILVAGHTVGDADPAIVLARLTGSGVFDTSFGNGGVLVRPFPNKTVQIHDMAIDPQGRAVIVGSENNDFLAARFTTTGAFDTSFNGDGLAVQPFAPDYDEATAVAIQPDGKIVVGGIAYNADRTRTTFVGLRLNNDGFLDRTFDTDGLISAGLGKELNIRSVSLESDKQIAFAGDTASTSRAADTRPVVLHFNQDGSRDTTFGSNGVLQLDTGSSGFNSVFTQTNGKLALAGSRSTGSQDLWFMARLGKGPFEEGTDGNFYVTGDTGDETITVAPDGTRLRVTIDDRYGTTRARSSFDRMIIDGAGGNDTITLNIHGRFNVHGGGGNDVITGSDGTEMTSGGAGNDQLHGNGGNDWMEDGDGDDVVNGGPGEDLIFITDGNDVINGGGEADKITASTFSGAKRINGEGGNDSIFGGE